MSGSIGRPATPQGYLAELQVQHSVALLLRVSCLLRMQCIACATIVQCSHTCSALAASIYAHQNRCRHDDNSTRDIMHSMLSLHLYRLCGSRVIMFHANYQWHQVVNFYSYALTRHFAAIAQCTQCCATDLSKLGITQVPHAAALHHDHGRYSISRWVQSKIMLCFGHDTRTIFLFKRHADSEIVFLVPHTRRVSQPQDSP